jgi:hypothetical protein
MCVHQGDQIGRIFAYLAVAYFGQFCNIIKVSKIVGPLFFHSASYGLFLAKIKNGLGSN